MNVVDFGILVVVGLFAVGGLTRGLLLGFVDLILLGVAVIVGARGSAAVAAPLIEQGLPGELAAGLGFVAALLLTLLVTGVAARILLAPLRGLGAGSVLGWLNSLLGMAAGAVRGVAFVFLALLVIQALPVELGYRPALAESRLVAPIVETGSLVLDSGLAWAGIDRSGLGLPVVGDG
jgi:uncharacterized membrane protein required for colicin V production